MSEFEPGPALDLLVAHLIMREEPTSATDPRRVPKPYSTDDACARLVVAELEAQEFKVAVEEPRHEGGSFTCTATLFYPDIRTPAQQRRDPRWTPDIKRTGRATGRTYAHAVCQAALEAFSGSGRRWR
jgi:hypothetical protein